MCRLLLSSCNLNEIYSEIDTKLSKLFSIYVLIENYSATVYTQIENTWIWWLFKNIIFPKYKIAVRFFIIIVIPFLFHYNADSYLKVIRSRILFFGEKTVVCDTNKRLFKTVSWESLSENWNSI